MPAPEVPPATRPRYARITAAGAALLVTLVAVLGGLGALPVSPATADSGQPAAAGRAAPAPADPSQDGAMSLTDGGYAPGATSSAPSPASGAASSTPASTPSATPSSSTGSSTAPASPSSQATGATDGSTTGEDALPADSGSGRRVVFDMSAQRVWLVDASGGEDEVQRTYLVSGSVTDNLHPGSYEVYSKSMHAIGVDDSGTMQYMVRFTHGENAAIGFHDIPVLDGHLVQTRAQLGQPQSHGCIRQWRPDAKALWSFAPVGTRVVVVA